ncbi:hypothetical protein A6A25_39550 [Saccharothrix sp. CB00851]|nr:hypothetical protein A6A25_39550 [Saccharothrix sp. CB00851]
MIGGEVGYGVQRVQGPLDRAGLADGPAAFEGAVGALRVEHEVDRPDEQVVVAIRVRGQGEDGAGGHVQVRLAPRTQVGKPPSGWAMAVR